MIGGSYRPAVLAIALGVLVQGVQAQSISASIPIGLEGQESWIGCNPRIVRVGSLLVSTWAGNHGSILRWATSSDEGRTWALQGILGPDPATLPLKFCDGQPTLVSDGGTRIFVALTAKENGGPAQILFRRGTASANTIVWDPLVAAVTFDPLGQRRPDSPWLTCDPATGNLYLIYVSQGERFYPYRNGPADLPVYFTRSADGGQTWSTPELIGGPAALGTRVEVGESGQVYVIWKEYYNSQLVMRRSDDHGLSFSVVRPIAHFIENELTRARGTSTTKVRYHPLDSYKSAGAFDLPQLAIDRTNGPRRGTLYAVWAEGAEGTTVPGTGNVVVESEPNDSPSTGNPIQIGDDFVSYGDSEIYAPLGDIDFFSFDATKGTLLQLWGAEDHFPQPTTPGAEYGRNVVFQADMPSLGDPHLFQGTILVDGTADPILFTVPRTSRYSIRGALGGGPNSIIKYGWMREFLPTPASVARDHRDIVITWSRDGGITWSPKMRVNDDPPGVDQALPAVAVDDVGRVHVAWLDRREPPAGEVVDAYWSVSHDGGLTFWPSRRLSTTSSDYGLTEGIRGIPSDYLALTPDAGAVYVAWPQISGGWPVATMVRITDVPTGTAIARFVAEPRGEAVRLVWSVQDAQGITGFRIHRAPAGSEDFEALAALAAHGAGEYEHVDAEVLAGRSYRYQLEVQRGPTSSWEGPVEIHLPSGIRSLAFERVGPNPFASEAHLVLAVPERSWLDVRIFDVMGHEVRRLHSGEAPAGRHALAWDGLDGHGHVAPPGVYHLRATGGRQSATSRIVRIR